MRLSTLAPAAAALLSAAALWPTPAAAQPQTESPAASAPAAPEDVKVNQLIVYGNDPCPASTDNEVTVCARRPEDERYRIPPNMRGNPNDPASTSWTERAERLETVGRTGINSCSPVGPAGGTGCLSQLIRQAREEQAGDGTNWTQLVEEARRKRLDQLDAKSEEIERELQAEGR